jgi:hypothetical protein
MHTQHDLVNQRLGMNGIEKQKSVYSASKDVASHRSTQVNIDYEFSVTLDIFKNATWYWACSKRIPHIRPTDGNTPGFLDIAIKHR